MKILVVGSGGREHALVWKLAQHHSPVFCAPGNAGMSRIARCVDIAADDIPKLVDFAARERIELTVAGPEAPLVAGMGDDFARRGLPFFGPVRAAARLEGDKSFAKQTMRKLGIPTAEYEVFREYEPARDYIQSRPMPIVVKASGLAGGKGAVVCETREQADAALKMMLKDGGLGIAGRTVVIEEFLKGEEASLIGLCDGKRMEMLVPSQDHKRLLDNNRGPNTGGMGAIAPASVVTEELARQVEELIFKPLIEGLRRQGVVYQGALYAGIMLTERGPMVLEFNCRFGDPETQAVLPLLEGDLGGVMEACTLGDMADRHLQWSGKSAVCVVAASKGYPGSYRTGVPITGELEQGGDTIIFHAGTKREGDKIVTSGGRVLAVTGIGPTLREAQARAYEGLEKIRFDGMVYRKDIGTRNSAFAIRTSESNPDD